LSRSVTMACSVRLIVNNSNRCALNSPRSPPILQPRFQTRTRVRRPKHRLPPRPPGRCAAPPVVTSCSIRPRYHRSDVRPHEPLRVARTPLDVSHTSRHSPSTLRCPSHLSTHRKIWPPRRLCSSMCLATASLGGLYAFCHLSHVLVWEYNIPQWLAVARHVASGVWLKVQRRPYRIRPA
jgi:hypothetical protein